MAYQPTILNGETVFRNEVFQTYLMSQLLDGIYDGEMTIGELLSHGNFGVGTFNYSTAKWSSSTASATRYATTAPYPCPTCASRPLRRGHQLRAHD